MWHAERSEGTGVAKKLGKMRKKLVLQEVIYALVCDKEDDRVEQGLELTK